jgi:putative transposase
VPEHPDTVWSTDFMLDALACGRSFRTFSVTDDFNREIIHIEVDTSITSHRLVRIFERIRQERPLLQVLRTDNGREFLGEVFVEWAKQAGMAIQYSNRASRTGTPTSSVSTAPTAKKCSTTTCSHDWRTSARPRGAS